MPMNAQFSHAKMVNFTDICDIAIKTLNTLNVFHIQQE